MTSARFGKGSSIKRSLAYSNTDLNNLADEMLGRVRVTTPWSTAALDFGSHFHSAILEPEQYEKLANDFPFDVKGYAQWVATGKLARVIKRYRYPRHVCYLGQAEQSYTATHTATGLTVKVRPDLLIGSPQKRRRTLVDFKTTSCKDLAQVLDTVDKFGARRSRHKKAPSAVSESGYGQVVARTFSPRVMGPLHLRPESPRYCTVTPKPL